MPEIPEVPVGQAESDHGVKSWAERPTGFPTRQCKDCDCWSHARSKHCHNCGGELKESDTPVATRARDRVDPEQQPAIRRRSRSNEAAFEAAVNLVSVAGGVDQARDALDKVIRLVRRLPKQ